MHTPLDNRVGSACLFASAARTRHEAVAPKVLLYHSFDRGLEKADFSAAAVKVSVDGEVTRRDDGVRGPQQPSLLKRPPPDG